MHTKDYFIMPLSVQKMSYLEHPFLLIQFQVLPFIDEIKVMHMHDAPTRGSTGAKEADHGPNGGPHGGPHGGSPGPASPASPATAAADSEVAHVSNLTLGLDSDRPKAAATTQAGRC